MPLYLLSVFSVTSETSPKLWNEEEGVNDYYSSAFLMESLSDQLIAASAYLVEDPASRHGTCGKMKLWKAKN